MKIAARVAFQLSQPSHAVPEKKGHGNHILYSKTPAGNQPGFCYICQIIPATLFLAHDLPAHQWARTFVAATDMNEHGTVEITREREHG